MQDDIVGLQNNIRVHVSPEGDAVKLLMVTIEDLVPQEHFLRKLEAALDLSFVYEETSYLYSRRYGRPPVDPAVLVKYLLVGYLYGIPSERQIWCEGTFAAQKWGAQLNTHLATGIGGRGGRLQPKQRSAIDKYFRIVFDNTAADWTFVCPQDYREITDKQKRIAEFYKDGFRYISEALAEIGYFVELRIPKRYRRHFDIMSGKISE